MASKFSVSSIWQGKAKAPAPTVRGAYWAKRQDMMYYHYVLMLAQPLADDAKSLIDVGSHGTSIAEEFDWIPNRVALDLRTPYSSETVRGIRIDFLEYEPEQRFDFALCLQVLEHIPDAAAFAKKLLAVADRVLISVPYKWPKGGSKEHCQDPVDDKKIADWFGRRPEYTCMVQEPFQKKQYSRRLIAYFHTPGEKFNMRKYRERARQPAGSAVTT